MRTLVTNCTNKESFESDKDIFYYIDSNWDYYGSYNNSYESNQDYFDSHESNKFSNFSYRDSKTPMETIKIPWTPKTIVDPISLMKTFMTLINIMKTLVTLITLNKTLWTHMNQMMTLMTQVTLKKYSNYCEGNSWSQWPIVRYHVSLVLSVWCHISGVMFMYHLSCGRCQVTGVKCQVSPVTCHISEQSKARATNPPPS